MCTLNNHCREANILDCINHRLNVSTAHLPNPSPPHFHPSSLGKTERLLPSEISLSAQQCLILSSKNYSPTVSSSWILIWQQLCSVNSFSKNSFHLCTEIAFLKWSVDKGCCCSGEMCLSPARRRQRALKWCQRTPSRRKGQLALHSSLLEVLSFPIFTLASALFPPCPLGEGEMMLLRNIM